MTKLKSFIKKSIYTIAGEKAYSKAYVKAKINDIKANGYEEAELDFVRHFIPEDGHVLDLGANYGHYCVKMAELCPKGKVFAFEPIPFTFNVLKEVVNRFQLTNVELHHCAVSDKDGQITMQLPLLDFGGPNTGVAHIGNSTNSESKEFSVKTCQIDAIEFDHPIHFIKMDIEGHEPIAVQGMIDLLKKDKPTILIEFSHTCMIRSSHEPSLFAEMLTQELSYQFYSLVGEQLVLVKDKHPADGYYFLIHQAQAQQFNHLIAK